MVWFPVRYDVLMGFVVEAVVYDVEARLFVAILSTCEIVTCSVHDDEVVN